MLPKYDVPKTIFSIIAVKTNGNTAHKNVARFAHLDGLVHCLEDALQPLAHDRMVVHQQHVHASSAQR